MHDMWNIQPPSDDIRSYQDPTFFISKFVYNLFPRPLMQITMYRTTTDFITQHLSTQRIYSFFGFNKDNDYFNTPPDWHIFAASRYNLPGTAYNLTFVLEKENQHGK
jgi:hypothetical protein